MLFILDLLPERLPYFIAAYEKSVSTRNYQALTIATPNKIDDYS